MADARPCRGSTTDNGCMSDADFQSLQIRADAANPVLAQQQAQFNTP